MDSDEPLTDEERDREMALALQRQLNYQEQGVAAQQQVVGYDYSKNSVRQTDPDPTNQKKGGPDSR